MIAALVVVIAVAFVEMVLRLRLFSHGPDRPDLARGHGRGPLRHDVRRREGGGDAAQLARPRRQTGLFVIKVLVALALPMAIIAIAGAMGPRTTAVITAELLSPLAIAAMTVVAALYGWARHAVARRL